MGTASVLPRAAALLAQAGPPGADEVEKMTAGVEPAIAVSHVGFRPDAQKLVIVRNRSARSFVMRDISSGPAFPD